MMNDTTAPACPKCGSTNVKKIGQSDGDSAIYRNSQLPTTKTVAYKCQCGLAFVQTERVESAYTPGSVRD